MVDLSSEGRSIGSREIEVNDQLSKLVQQLKIAREKSFIKRQSALKKKKEVKMNTRKDKAQNRYKCKKADVRVLAPVTSTDINTSEINTPRRPKSRKRVIDGDGSQIVKMKTKQDGSTKKPRMTTGMNDDSRKNGNKTANDVVPNRRELKVVKEKTDRTGKNNVTNGSFRPKLNESQIRERRLKETERKRKQRANNAKNLDKVALEKDKEHQRYLKRKEARQIKSIKDMTKRAQRKQRKAWRNNTNARRERCKEQNKPENNSSLNDSSCSTDKRIQAGKRRSQLNRNIVVGKASKLEGTLRIITAKAERYKKRYQRLLASQMAGSSPSPRTKVRKLLRGRVVGADVKRKLLYGEVWQAQLQKQSRACRTDKAKQLLVKVIGCSIIRKYRLMRKSRSILCERKCAKFQYSDNARTRTRTGYQFHGTCWEAQVLLASQERSSNYSIK